jgi:hypothetical protein
MNGPFQLRHDVWGRLILSGADGQEFVGVEVSRAFPFTDPQRWLAVCDAQGHELILIEDPQTLEPELREMLLQELGRREFAPIIERILRVQLETDPSQWEVETDRGPVQFLVNSEEDIRRLGPHRRLIVDTHGLRYLVPDTRRLDAGSRKILDHYL